AELGQPHAAVRRELFDESEVDFVEKLGFGGNRFSRPRLPRHLTEISVDRPFHDCSFAATMSKWRYRRRLAGARCSAREFCGLHRSSTSSAARSSTTWAPRSPCFSSHGSSRSASPGCG